MALGSYALDGAHNTGPIWMDGSSNDERSNGPKELLKIKMLLHVGKKEESRCEAKETTVIDRGPYQLAMFALQTRTNKCHVKSYTTAKLRSTGV